MKTFAEQFLFDFWNKIKPRKAPSQLEVWQQNLSEDLEARGFAKTGDTGWVHWRPVPSDLAAQPVAEQLEFPFVKNPEDVQP